ncbi:hypothetical protein AWC38_SpisGene25202 [Stylophora pistillata]|uniref:Uncharacterized protein n=1 Tax=Stylophora pistillata TaxID=50429 RepID=A0A2B4R3X5_STYPI|nr:hypothetical protein AWC38_SpisGene25202 [Stylophora pistillata]
MRWMKQAAISIMPRFQHQSKDVVEIAKELQVDEMYHFVQKKLQSSGFGKSSPVQTIVEPNLPLLRRRTLSTSKPPSEVHKSLRTGSIIQTVESSPPPKARSLNPGISPKKSEISANKAMGSIPSNRS